MKRSNIRRLIGLSLAVLSVCAQAAEVEKPRNLLFIYVEDLGYYTSERGLREPESMIAGLETPNLDRLASRSLIFTRAFCGQSVCSPSKGAIYTGLMPHANGIWRNVFNRAKDNRGPEKWIPLPEPLTEKNDPSNTGVGGVHEDLPTLIERFKEKDIYCALSNKLHVQPARKFPYDGIFDPGDLKGVIEAAGDKPWFFWSNPGDTHAPFWSSVRSKLKNPKDGNSAPNDVDPDKIGMLPWLPDTPAARIDLSQYYSNVRNMDEFVGRILADLEDSGLADQTMVVFTGDHGIPVQRGKTSVYPAGTNVPCFISGPGVKVERIVTTPISQADFNPTFLEVFGLAAGDDCHGRSLWPILSGRSDAIPDRRTILTETNNSLMSAPGDGNTTAARAVCDGRYYYIRNLIQETVSGPVEKVLFIGSGSGEYGDPGAMYSNDMHNDTVREKDKQPLPYELLRQLCMNDAPPEELYDLDADPWAVRNLVDDPANAEVLERMRKELTRWREFTHDPDQHPRHVKRRTAAVCPSDS